MIDRLLMALLLVIGAAGLALAEAKDPVEIEALELDYDHNLDAAIAKGEVRVTQGKQVILADEVVYLKKQDKLYAKGNVAALREDGSIYYADVLQFEKKMHQGRMLSFKARIGAHSLFAARSAEVISKKRTKLYTIVFSPCRICESNLRSFVPLWQMRAAESSINLDTETVHYKHARIEAHGVPILYTPYFSTPTPGAKRKTGFLQLGFKNSSTTGGAIQAPFYLNIAPNKDFTYSPSIAVTKGEVNEVNNSRNKATVHEMEFRHKLKHGEYHVNASLAKSSKVGKAGNPLPGQYTYGHLDARGSFLQPSGLLSGNYGFQIQQIRDPSLTYTKLYKLMSEDVLTNNLYYYNLKKEYYLDSRAISFKDLRPGRYSATTPNAIPFIKMNHKHRLYGADIDTKISALHLYRAQGTNYKRVSWESAVKKPMPLPYGQLFSLSFKLRGDAYQVGYKKIQDHNAVAQNSGGSSGNYGRLYPQLKAEWSYPLINRMRSSSIVLEPVMQLIMSPNRRVNDKIPNEDSQAFEVSAGNLFSDNKYLGVDRIETGNRANYGIRGSINQLLLKNLYFMVGQSYHMKKPGYQASSGLQSKLSDYVAQIAYEPISNLEVLHRARIDRHKGTLNRHELELLYEYKKLKVAADYSAASKKAVNYASIYRQEIFTSVGYNIYDAWWITAKSRRNLGKKPANARKALIANGVGLNYNGECLNMGVEVSRDYTQLKNLMPTTTYLFTIQIPSF